MSACLFSSLPHRQPPRTHLVGFREVSVSARPVNSPAPHVAVKTLLDLNRRWGAAQPRAHRGCARRHLLACACRNKRTSRTVHSRTLYSTPLRPAARSRGLVTGWKTSRWLLADSRRSGRLDMTHRPRPKSQVRASSPNDAHSSAHRAPIPIRVTKPGDTLHRIQVYASANCVVWKHCVCASSWLS